MNEQRNHRALRKRRALLHPVLAKPRSLLFMPMCMRCIKATKGMRGSQGLLLVSGCSSF